MSLRLVQLYHSSPAYSAVHRLRESDERGMSTAEYAIGTIAAVTLAGVLLALVGSGAIKDLIGEIMKSAFTVKK